MRAAALALLLLVACSSGEASTEEGPAGQGGQGVAGGGAAGSAGSASCASDWACPGDEPGSSALACQEGQWVAVPCDPGSLCNPESGRCQEMIPSCEEEGAKVCLASKVQRCLSPFEVVYLPAEDGCTFPCISEPKCADCQEGSMGTCSNGLKTSCKGGKLQYIPC